MGTLLPVTFSVGIPCVTLTISVADPFASSIDRFSGKYLISNSI